MGGFTLETSKGIYNAEEQKNGYWIVYAKFKTMGGGIIDECDEATFIYKRHADTAVVQKLFSVDKAII